MDSRLRGNDENFSYTTPIPLEPPDSAGFRWTRRIPLDSAGTAGFRWNIPSGALIGAGNDDISKFVIPAKAGIQVPFW